MAVNSRDVTYSKFMDVFCSVKSSLYSTKDLLFKAGQKKWNDLKKYKLKLIDVYANLVAQSVTPASSKATLFQFAKPRSTSSSSSNSDPEVTIVEAQPATPLVPDESNQPQTEANSTQVYLTPTQTKLEKKILEDTAKLNAYKASINSGICPDLADAKSKIKKLESTISDSLKQKKRLVNQAISKRKARTAKKRKVEELMEQHPEISSKLQCLATSDRIGRPTYENNDELLKVIKEIAILGSGADDRRNSEMIRSIRSLDDLTTELNQRGFEIKRSTVYLRLQPRKYV